MSRPRQRWWSVVMTAATVWSILALLAGSADAQASKYFGLNRFLVEQLVEYPEGVVLDRNSAAYYDGTLIVSFPDQAGDVAPAVSNSALVGSVNGCPAGDADNRWYCFYQDKDFKGRRVQWNLQHCGIRMRLSDVGFQDQASSWVNTGQFLIYVESYSPKGNGAIDSLWTEGRNTKSSWVGSANNDKADLFQAC